MSMQIAAASSMEPSQYSASSEAKAGANSVLAVPFSARVGSETFSGDVEHINGEYEGSVSNLMGVNSAAPTVGRVEDRLVNLIDFFA